MIVDGHNDLVLRLWQEDTPKHIYLDDAVAAGFAGGFFALYVPGPSLGPAPEPPYAAPLDEPIPTEEAARVAWALLDTLDSMPVARATRASDFVEGRVTAIAHLEGADPLAPDLSDLEEWYGCGIRSIGLVWSRANAFAEGVPFRFPDSPDTGPGLTAAGRELVRACNRLGILVDLSHLNEAGFWDVARLSDAPLVATHSNAHALCASTRNLTDEQLDAVRDSGGMVGVNFAVGFLREDGRTDADTPITEIVRHVDYLVDRMGIDHVGLGSDFEGALMPAELGGVAGLPKLVDALRDAGYRDGTLDKLTHANWLRVLDATWNG